MICKLLIEIDNRVEKIKEFLTEIDNEQVIYISFI